MLLGEQSENAAVAERVFLLPLDLHPHQDPHRSH